MVKVAHSGLSEKESVENIMTAVDALCKSLPGGANNIRNMHIKTADSPALPIYMSEGNCYPKSFQQCMYGRTCFLMLVQ